MAASEKIVLIVDDSPIIIERLKIMLQDLTNVRVVMHAGTYSAALSLLTGSSPDIAILDINLPDKSGIELLRYIKKNHREITVIMLSNQSGDYYRNLCKLNGADHFIDKSSEFERVPGIILSLH
jgi:DNA-binding NarL/FixJ family response regulator